MDVGEGGGGGGGRGNGEWGKDKIEEELVRRSRSRGMYRTGQDRAVGQYGY